LMVVLVLSAVGVVEGCCFSCRWLLFLMSIVALVLSCS
jgi:hypothetical protein